MSEREADIGDDSVKGEVPEADPYLPAVDEDDLDAEILTDEGPGAPEAAGEWFTPVDDDL
jgi:hypothetical protein